MIHHNNQFPYAILLQASTNKSHLISHIEGIPKNALALMPSVTLVN